MPSSKPGVRQPASPTRATRKRRAILCISKPEVHRLRGDFTEAEHAYRGARQMGRDAQPGLSAAARCAGPHRGTQRAPFAPRCKATPAAPLRARILPAYIEIMLAASDLTAAKEACAELEGIAARFTTDDAGHDGGARARQRRPRRRSNPGCARSVAACTSRLAAGRRAVHRGAGQGDAGACFSRARRCRRRSARARARARGVRRARRWPRCGSAERRARSSGRRSKAACISTRRASSAVLRKLATGQTNKAIAKALFVSEKTIDRHVSNIFAKANLPSRAAATAFAYQRGLV